ncbi:MAG: hypothetical protein LUD15_00565 [Bacteroides sp.]|nr:hypothetical protein [Bacteroides sp.]
MKTQTNFAALLVLLLLFCTLPVYTQERVELPLLSPSDAVDPPTSGKKQDTSESSLREAKTGLSKKGSI